MGYDLMGYNFLNAGGYTPYGAYGMNMTAPLYMMNFYDQLQKLYTGSAKAGSTASGAGTAEVTSAGFQTAFQEAFRKALQETMGVNGNTSQAASGSGESAAPDRRICAQSAYQTMSSYRSHPSRIWTSSLSHS